MAFDHQMRFLVAVAMTGVITASTVVAPAASMADPVFYYLYVNPVPPDLMQEYGPAGPPGSSVVCLDNGACGIKATLFITMSPGENAHPPAEIFADWRACRAYEREIAQITVGGFRFFCLGTDYKAFW